MISHGEIIFLQDGCKEFFFRDFKDCSFEIIHVIFSNKSNFPTGFKNSIGV